MLVQLEFECEKAQIQIHPRKTLYFTAVELKPPPRPTSRLKKKTIFLNAFHSIVFGIFG